MGLLRSLTRLGITDALPVREIRYVIFLNVVVLLVTFIGVQNILFASLYLPGTGIILVALILHAVFIDLTLFWNRRGQYLIARLWFSVTAALFLTVHTILTGTEPRWQLFLAVCVFLMFYLFPPRERRWMYSLVGLFSVCFIATEVWFHQNGLLAGVPKQFLLLQYYFNTIGVLFCALSMGGVGYVTLKNAEETVARHLARLEEELEAARRLQMGMVPQSFPAPTPGCPVEVFASMVPAREVGGDLYDFFNTADGRFCFLIGDVSGKGMPAALFMARTKSLIRVVTELMSGDSAQVGPADILDRVNQELCAHNDDMMFVTLFFGMLNPNTGELQFCNAGHNPPYRLTTAGAEIVEGGKGLVLGVRRSAAYQTERLSLLSGESIYLFTDGVTEANDRSGALYGEERLEAVVAAVAGKSSADVVAAVAAAVRTFVGTAEPFDDIAMMAVRRRDPLSL